MYINIFSTPSPLTREDCTPLVLSPLTPSTPVHAFGVRMNYKYLIWLRPWLCADDSTLLYSKRSRPVLALTLYVLLDSSCCVSLPRGAMGWSVILAFSCHTHLFMSSMFFISTKINDGSGLLSVWMYRWTFSFFLVVGLGVSRINGVCLPKCIIGFSDFKL